MNALVLSVRRRSFPTTDLGAAQRSICIIRIVTTICLTTLLGGEVDTENKDGRDTSRRLAATVEALERPCDVVTTVDLVRFSSDGSVERFSAGRHLRDLVFADSERLASTEIDEVLAAVDELVFDTSDSSDLESVYVNTHTYSVAIREDRVVQQSYALPPEGAGHEVLQAPTFTLMYDADNDQASVFESGGHRIYDCHMTMTPMPIGPSAADAILTGGLEFVSISQRSGRLTWRLEKLRLEVVVDQSNTLHSARLSGPSSGRLTFYHFEELDKEHATPWPYLSIQLASSPGFFEVRRIVNAELRLDPDLGQPEFRLPSSAILIDFRGVRTVSSSSNRTSWPHEFAGFVAGVPKLAQGSSNGDSSPSSLLASILGAIGLVFLVRALVSGRNKSRQEPIGPPPS